MAIQDAPRRRPFHPVLTAAALAAHAEGQATVGYPTTIGAPSVMAPTVAESVAPPPKRTKARAPSVIHSVAPSVRSVAGSVASSDPKSAASLRSRGSRAAEVAKKVEFVEGQEKRRSGKSGKVNPNRAGKAGRVLPVVA